jgi:hypothetical protein
MIYKTNLNNAIKILSGFPKPRERLPAMEFSHKKPASGDISKNPPTLVIH